MKIERSEVVWMESRSDYTAGDLAEMSGLSAELLQDLMECGALPARSERSGVYFASESVALVRTARRLRDDFDLDANGIAVAVSLLRRVRALEGELAYVRARSTRIFDERGAEGR